MPASLDDAERALIRQSAETHDILKLTVKGCAYSCCGKGWRRRDYEAEYVGYVSGLKDDGEPWTFLLVSPGLGTVSYTIAVRDWEVELVERRDG